MLSRLPRIRTSSYIDFNLRVKLLKSSSLFPIHEKSWHLLISALAVGLGFAYLFYLITPARQGEFNYFSHLPSALLGLAIFAGKNPGGFIWPALLALAGLGIAFLVLERIFKVRAPFGLLLGTGMGTVGLIIFLLGASHLLFPNLIRGLIIILAIPGGYFSFVRLLTIKKTAAGAIELIIVGIFGTALLLALAHPTYFYDALYYHLALPRQYLIRNTIAPIPTISYSYFPETAEMIYLAGLASGGQTAAQLVNFIFWAAIILLAREIFQAWFGAERKILATALLLALPIFSFMAGMVSNDLVAAFFILAGTYALSNEDWSLDRRSLLFGICAGFACSTKPTSYIYMLAPQSIWLAYILLKSGGKKFLKNACIAAIAFFIICLPFWLRNILSVGNPFYPALAGIFGGPLSAAQAQAIWQDAHGVTLGSGLWRELFRLPHDFKYSPIGDTGNTSAIRFFPLFGFALPAGLLLFLLRKNLKKLAPVILYSDGFYIIWAFSFRLSRFALGLWIILAILSAGGFSALAGKGKSLRSLAGALVSVALIVGLVLELLSGARLNGWNMLTRRWTAEEYLSHIASIHPVEMGAYPVYQWLNRNSDPNDEVALLGPTSLFYLERNALANSWIDENPLVRHFNSGKTALEVCSILQEDKIRYLVYQPLELDRLGSQYPVNRLSEQGRARLEVFISSPCLERVMSNEKQKIYLFRLIGK